MFKLIAKIGQLRKTFEFVNLLCDTAKYFHEQAIQRGLIEETPATKKPEFTITKDTTE